MASLLERLKYIIEDIFGKKTYAESQRDKYKKVVRNLEKELKKTDNLSDVMAQLATDYNTMEMNPDSAQGKLSDTFVTKESENREAVEKLGADFKEIIAEVKSKLEFARDEYNYWCDEAKREDEEMKIYQQQYYEEEERLRRVNELLTNMKAIKERIDDSYDELTWLMSRIESDKLWKGKEETTFMAYMGLMQQYHKSFSKANDDNPVQQAIEALKSHGDRVDDFYDEFQEYKDMEDMQ